MKKTALMLLVLLSTNLFATQTLIVPFISSASYEDQNKEADFQFGIYTNIKSDKNRYEIVYEHKNITYSTEQTNTSQHDFSLLYTYDATNSLKFRGSLHYIKSNLEKSDNIIMALGGVEKTSNNNIIGLNISQSKYNDTSLTNYVHQVSPYFGVFFAKENSSMGKLYAKISYDAIYPNGKNKTLNDVYSSFAIKITQNKGKMQNNFKYWVGEQLYAVRNSGLTIYNLDDIHNGGFSISTKYKFTKKYVGQFSYINENFKTYGTTTDSNMNRFLLSATFSF